MKNTFKKLLQISEECDLCGDCAKLCPFEAIVMTKEEDIMFKASSCVNECEVCALVCPKNAITFSYISPSDSCSGGCEGCNKNCMNKENR